MTHKSHIPLLQLATIVGLLVTIFGLSQSVLRLMGRKSILRTKQEELLRLQENQEVIQSKLTIAQTPEFVEKEAREKLNLAKAGETIVLIEQNEPVPQNSSLIPIQMPNWKKWWNLFF
jgi:cell division protein FtsB